MPTNILIVDNQSIYRIGIKKILENENNIKIVDEASNIQEGYNKAAKINVDILLMEADINDEAQLNLIKEINSYLSNVKIVILTNNIKENIINDDLKLGVSGVLTKDIEPEILIKALNIVASGSTFVQENLVSRMIDDINDSSDNVSNNTKNNTYSLTGREIEVLQMLSYGYSNCEIAKRLFLSEKTVKNHLTNVFRKINVSDRTQAVIFAIKNKIVILN